MPAIRLARLQRNNPLITGHPGTVSVLQENDATFHRLKYAILSRVLGTNRAICHETDGRKAVQPEISGSPDLPPVDLPKPLLKDINRYESFRKGNL